MTTIRAIPTATPARTLTWTDGKLTGDKEYAARAKTLLSVDLTPVGPTVPVDWTDPDSATATMHAALTHATGGTVFIVGHRLKPVGPGCCDKILSTAPPRSVANGDRLSAELRRLAEGDEPL